MPAFAATRTFIIATLSFLVAVVIAAVTLGRPAEAASQQQLCRSAAYECTSGGYAGQSVGWAGRWFGAGSASSNQYGYHNCVLYAAYRLMMNGLPDPGNLGSASTWNDRAPAGSVNGTPAVGAIAQWERGHVAYVEEVRADGIVTSDDNYGSNYTSRNFIPVGSSSWPNAFIHLRDQVVGPPTEGQYVSHGGAVYRIVGGAPLYVSNWVHIGGAVATRALTDEEFSKLRAIPAEGTLIWGSAPGHPQSGSAYRITGGAPVHVTDWSRVGAPPASATMVDLAAILHAGEGGVWNHLRPIPADGTLIWGSAPGQPLHGSAYRITGGAPVAVTDWGRIGAAPGTAQVVDLAAIVNAGTGGVWDHLRATPADGTLIWGAAPGDALHGSVYRVTGGAPVHVTDWARVGAGPGSAQVADLAAIVNAGTGGQWNHLRAQPADGTLIWGSAPGDPLDGSVYRIAGGAPVYVSDWSRVGAGPGAAQITDLAAIVKAGSGGAWNHLNFHPANGTFLVASPTPKVYRVEAGVPVYVASWDAFGGPQPTVGVDVAAIDNAGKPGVWAHLKSGAPAAGAPAAPTALAVTAGYGQVDVAFTPGVTKGSAITGYQVSVDDGATWQPATTGVNPTTVTVSGLANGRAYPLRLRAVNAAGPGVSSAAVTATSKGAVFTALAPTRVYDSRTAGAGGALAAGAPRTISVAANNAVPQGAVAVAYNITAADTRGSGYLAVAPGGTSSIPATSSLNWSNAGEVVANGFTVGVNSERSIAVFGGGSGSTQFVVDIVGFYAPETVTPAGSVFVPIDPARAYDSRSAGQTALPVGSSRQVSVAAGGKVPANATGVAYNLTETDTAGAGFLSVAPGGQSKPAVSTINWNGNQTMANSTTVGVTNGAISVFAGGSGSAHFIVDVVGYFVPAASAPQGARFTATAPVRTYDSRQASGPLTGGTGRITPVSTRDIVPAGAVAVAANLTQTGTVGVGYLAVAPGRASGPPPTSAINWTGDQTLANGMLLKSGATPEVSVYAGPSSQGVGANYIMDVSGYFI